MVTRYCYLDRYVRIELKIKLIEEWMPKKGFFLEGFSLVSYFGNLVQKLIVMYLNIVNIWDPDKK